MLNMFDYKKHSVLEYNTMLADMFNGGTPAITFKYTIKSIERNDKTLLIMFTNNHWIKVDKKGWWCEAYSDDTLDVITNRHFFTQDRTSQSLGLGNVAYVYRPSKGITYKNMLLKKVDITRSNRRANVNFHKQYYFNVEVFKKYKEYQLGFHAGTFVYEKINKNDLVLKTCIRVQEGKNTYSVHLEREGKKVTMRLTRNFKDTIVLPTKFKDCGIDNIYNKYMMFDFDLTANQDDFEIVEKVRTLLKKDVLDTYNNIRNDGQNTSVVGNVLRRIEVIESDEYQVQKRP